MPGNEAFLYQLPSLQKSHKSLSNNKSIEILAFFCQYSRAKVIDIPYQRSHPLSLRQQYASIRCEDIERSDREYGTRSIRISNRDDESSRSNRAREDSSSADIFDTRCFRI